MQMKYAPKGFYSSCKKFDFFISKHLENFILQS